MCKGHASTVQSQPAEAKPESFNHPAVTKAIRGWQNVWPLPHDREPSPLDLLLYELKLWRDWYAVEYADAGPTHRIRQLRTIAENVADLWPDHQGPRIDDMPGSHVNFATLQRAIKSGDACLLSTISKVDNTPANLICAVNRDGDEFEMVPLAILMNTNPYFAFHTPFPDEPAEIPCKAD